MTLRIQAAWKRNRETGRQRENKEEMLERRVEKNQSSLAVCWKAPNCLLQHVMTSLLCINLSLLAAIFVSMQEANRFILCVVLNEEGNGGLFTNRTGRTGAKHDFI